jgi:hypothetical protein
MIMVIHTSYGATAIGAKKRDKSHHKSSHQPIHKTKQLAWKRYKLAQAATKKMITHAFKERHYHFLELQDYNGDIVGYTAIELFDHLMDQYVQPEDVADQITALHKILEQQYDPNEEPQVYWRVPADSDIFRTCRGGAR